jgi:predicted DNA-binding ribbon-helix-helix protein
MPMSRRKRRRAKSTVVKRSIFTDGHRTSVSLEDEFWKGLKESAGVRRMTLSQLVASIDAERRRGSNLSSAIRLFVLDFYRQQNSPAVLISSDATAAERNMRRIARGQTVEAPAQFWLNQAKTPLGGSGVFKSVGRCGGRGEGNRLADNLPRACFGPASSQQNLVSQFAAESRPAGWSQRAGALGGC